MTNHYRIDKLDSTDPFKVEATQYMCAPDMKTVLDKINAIIGMPDVENYSYQCTWFKMKDGREYMVSNISSYTTENFYLV